MEQLSPESLSRMQRSWFNLCMPYSSNAESVYAEFDAIVKLYTGPHRHYHTLEHLGEMFRIVSRFSGIVSDLPSVQFAIWFHDVVYDTHRFDNEERSAEYAEQVLGKWITPVEKIQHICDLIMLTKTHNWQSDSVIDGNILLDADLAILGSAEQRYLRYAADIRKEYEWVDDEQYRVGRTKVLNTFLGRERIYHTQLIYEEGEATARANMQAEMIRA